MMGETVEIPLTKGMFTVVDLSDFHLVDGKKWTATKNGTKWYAARYEGGRKCRKKVYMHRVLMNNPPGKVVDHRDQDGLNNRRENLREANKSQNAANTPSRGKSGAKGVRWEEDRKKWAVQISIRGRRKFLGRFADKDAAIEAYARAAEEAFGEFAHLGGSDQGRTICLYMPPRGY